MLDIANSRYNELVTFLLVVHIIGRQLYPMHRKFKIIVSFRNNKCCRGFINRFKVHVMRLLYDSDISWGKPLQLSMYTLSTGISM